MRKRLKEGRTDFSVERIQPEYTKGLTSQQVAQRKEANLENHQPSELTRSVPKIVASNVFTLFNLLNIVLATTILILGDWKNALFIGVAISNTAIGIFQELRAKKAIDSLAIVAQSKVKVIRDGTTLQIPQEEIVLDDVMLVSEGQQLVADGDILYTQGLEVDESQLTGEANEIQKRKGELVMSGSVITAGDAYVHVTAVGKHSYANKLGTEAKKEKSKQSKLMRTMNNIFRVLTVVIVPLGALLFYSRYTQGMDFRTSVLGTTAAILGMIPEGLMLLTSVTFAVGAFNLTKRKTLVQTLPSIETLARVDVLCLDKTGTITDGNQTMERILPLSETPVEGLELILSEMMHSLRDDNPTARAIRAKYNRSHQWEATDIAPFSSRRKWSGASYGELGSYLIGAPDFLFDTLHPQVESSIKEYSSQGYRVLALGYSRHTISENTLPGDMSLLALLLLTDNLRHNASDTFQYFARQGVEIKVISGDNAVTVSKIAQQAGITNAEHFIDLSTVEEDADYAKMVKEYAVFGRVSPYQKRLLVQALQEQGKTVCMTGDGVNDVLALREADCAVAMTGASDAARGVADFVLLDSDFSAMIEVLKEGRRVINNIEKVASLYLVKTIYSTILTLLYIYLPFPYPFEPLQMSPINSLTVGIPSFFLALEANYQKPEGRFISNVLENSLPAALVVVFNILVLQLASVLFHFTQQELTTMVVLVTGAVGFTLLFLVSQPLNWKKNLMIGSLSVAFVLMFIVFRGFFNFSSLWSRNVFFYVPLLFSSRAMFNKLNQVVIALEDKFFRWRRKRKEERKRKANRKKRSISIK